MALDTASVRLNETGWRCITCVQGRWSKVEKHVKPRCEVNLQAEELQ